VSGDNINRLMRAGPRESGTESKREVMAVRLARPFKSALKTGTIHYRATQLLYIFGYEKT
jgi:hypothetical protein